MQLTHVTTKQKEMVMVSLHSHVVIEKAPKTLPKTSKHLQSCQLKSQEATHGSLIHIIPSLNPIKPPPNPFPFSHHHHQTPSTHTNKHPNGFQSYSLPCLPPLPQPPLLLPCLSLQQLLCPCPCPSQAQAMPSHHKAQPFLQLWKVPKGHPQTRRVRQVTGWPRRR